MTTTIEITVTVDDIPCTADDGIPSFASVWLYLHVDGSIKQADHIGFIDADKIVSGGATFREIVTAAERAGDKLETVCRALVPSAKLTRSDSRHDLIQKLVAAKAALTPPAPVTFGYAAERYADRLVANGRPSHNV